MRILFISAFAPIPNTHAGGQRVLQIIAGLSQFHEITLLTFIENEAEKEKLSSVGTYCQEVIPVLRKRRPHAFDPWRIKPRDLEVEYSSTEMTQLVKDAAFSRHFDLIQFEYLQSSMFIPDHSPTPMIITHHEVQSLAMERKMRMMPIHSLKRWMLFKEWMQMFRYEMTRLPRFNRVIVLTDEERQYLRKYLPVLPVEVNTMGVDCTFFQPLDEPEEPNSLVFVGYYKHEPNVDGAYWLIDEIMPRVLKNFPDVRLNLLGSQPPEGLKRKANGFDIQVPGWIPDIRPCLGRCSVFVAPLRLGAGMRGKVLEAWAMSRPIVSTSVGCAGMKACHQDNIMIADTKDAFADQICRLLQDANLRKRIGQSGLETVRANYDWKQLILQHNRIYENI
jgi:glycosyltransferase involved in cell wall biosynthesis